MQVTETLSQGLKREFKVVLPASDLAARFERELSDLKGKVQLKGFRPGKVPTEHLKRVYGRSVMGDVVQNAVNEANRKIVEDNGLRLAMEPKIEFPTDQAEVERALEAKGDLAYQVALEVLPQFDAGKFDDVELERPVAEVTEEEVNKAVDRMAERNRTYSAKDGAAEKGDKVKIDFVGKINDEAFEGGDGKDIDVVIGSETFIPGFEDQLLGISAGDERLVTVTFPENYMALHLAGKEAKFDVTAKGIETPGAVTLDEEFAKGFGFDTIDALKDAVKKNIGDEYAKLSRSKLKRSLLDALDKRYTFELPQSLVDQEFAGIWQQVEAEQKASGKTFADENTTEEKAREDYRRIAERRVRLGLVLAEVGEKAAVKVPDEDVTRALIERARQYPGQEKQVWDFYSKNPERLAELRAPLFEEKVVDHIISLAKVTDKTVSKDELFKFSDEEEAA
ncbi:trigger factor [Methylovirgula sp. 4M-Z18]|uniref:trigger factor n=1 Tax=Methylovirgula sp. 4M-Z18 TaxID=2293567 RepID=UPI000E2FD523|nr:trigger factor [Methylovirgula sp. 4M-Z18]RFB80466.1 trigger factor [Methylovirgula sp. 4M-Z18]